MTCSDPVLPAALLPVPPTCLGTVEGVALFAAGGDGAAALYISRDSDPGQPLSLRAARVHEAQGPGRIGFALYQMMRHSGALFWIRRRYRSARLMPPALPPGVNARLHLVEAVSEEDTLWAAEEALRARPVGLVVAQVEKPLSLTLGRRLQLAAEAGGTTGLMLIREGEGSNAAETRWHCAPLAGAAGSTLHRWRLIKNKSGTCAGWTVDWDGKAAVGNLVDTIAE